MSSADERILWTRAANRCAFRDPITNEPCPADLVHDGQAAAEGPTVVGEMAHIEGEKPGSARYRADMTDQERDAYANRVLMCRPHHKIIDTQEAAYPVARLKAMKVAHEEWVRRTLRPAKWKATAKTQFMTEDIYSSLLPVERIPLRVFVAPCRVGDERTLKERIGNQFIPAFIMRDGCFYTFWDLRRQPAYLRKLLNMRRCEVIPFHKWHNDEDKRRYYAELLDRCLNKVTGHRNLTLDKHHRRYFFAPTKPGSPRDEIYLSVAGVRTPRHVVWNPVWKKTGLPKKYWVHRAVRLRFHEVAPGSWVLAIRPEFHHTRDSVTPLYSEKVGPQTTQRKSRMWNYDLLQEVQFWRDYLGESRPRIILDMDGQALIISCNPLRATIEWPGIPNDTRPFRTAEIEEDLFSVAGLEAVLREQDDEGFELDDFEEGEEEETDGHQN